jgi:hypothetical protein
MENILKHPSNPSAIRDISSPESQVILFINILFALTLVVLQEQKIAQSGISVKMFRADIFCRRNLIDVSKNCCTKNQYFLKGLFISFIL